MSVLSVIAVVASMLVLFFGVGTLFAERGYSFDLRRRGEKRPSLGGRRQNDQLLSKSV
jgi:hypothetical protein